MMLGKQRAGGRPSPAPRQHVRRTTSLTEFAAPEDVLAEEEDEEPQLLPAQAAGEAAELDDPYGWDGWDIGGAGRADWLAAYRARTAPALAGRLRRNSAAETAAFLRACGLCNRRLGPGRDTFMYRGDTAFCSLECRQQHITIEEWKDKCAASDPVVPLPPSGGVGSDKPGTIATASSSAPNCIHTHHLHFDLRSVSARRPGPGPWPPVHHASFFLMDGSDVSCMIISSLESPTFTGGRCIQ